MQFGANYGLFLIFNLEKKLPQRCSEKFMWLYLLAQTPLLENCSNAQHWFEKQININNELFHLSVNDAKYLLCHISLVRWADQNYCMPFRSIRGLAAQPLLNTIISTYYNTDMI